MTILSVFLIVFFLLISGLLCREVYRGTEQDLPHAHRYGRHLPRNARHSWGLDQSHTQDLLVSHSAWV